MPAVSTCKYQEERRVRVRDWKNMDNVKKQATLLYKQQYISWLNEQEETGKSSRNDIDQTRMYCGFAREIQDERNFSAFGGCIGSLCFEVNISELELFRFTDRKDGKVTTFTLSLEDSNLDCLTSESQSQNGEEGQKSNVYSQSAGRRYSPVYVCNVIRGSMIGTQFLAYSAYGHIFVVDWATKKGRIVGLWPIDENEVFYNYKFIDPEIAGAISGDGSLVVVSGPTYDGHDSNTPPSYNIMRFFNVKTQQCSVKKLSLDPVLDPYTDICGMSFNPYHSNLLYLSCIYDDSLDDPIEVPSNWVFVAYDFIQGKMLAKRDNIKTKQLIDAYTYSKIDSPVFLHDGHMVAAYHIEQGGSSGFNQADYILLLDAFTLDTVATVKFAYPNDFVNYHFVVSTCQTKISVFKRNAAHEVEVYKIPINNISLMYQCKQTIIKCMGRLNKVKKLTMLPQPLRDYLTLH